MTGIEHIRQHLATVTASTDWADVAELRSWYVQDVAELLAALAAAPSETIHPDGRPTELLHNPRKLTASETISETIRTAAPSSPDNSNRYRQVCLDICTLIDPHMGEMGTPENVFETVRRLVEQVRDLKVIKAHYEEAHSLPDICCPDMS
jgi:hypothetical protein